MHARTRSILASLAIVLALVIAIPAGAANSKPPAGTPHADKVILFASDGMRPDLMERYAADGLMPTYADLMFRGFAATTG